MNGSYLNLVPANLKHGLIAMGWLCLALLLRNTLPWFFWLMVIGIPAWAAIKVFLSAFSPTTSKFLCRLTLVMLALQTGWAVIRCYYYNPALPTYWRDDLNYYAETQSIVTAWKSGFYPDISLKGTLPYLGTLHTGYHRILSAVFFLTGISVLPGLILNAICASLMPILSALTVVQIMPVEPAGQESQSKTIASLAALFTALHPTQFYWASYLLKDTFTAFAFFTTLVLVMHSIRRWDMLSIIAAIILLPFLFTVRAYSSLSIIAGCSCLILLQIPRKMIVQWSLTFACLIFIFLTYTYTGNRIWEQVRDSFVSLLPAAANQPGSLLVHVISGVPRLFLSPYSWMYVDPPSPMYGLYPGMIYLYLVVYPLGFAGIAYVVARNIRISIIPLLVFGFAALLFLASNFGGAASRQRFYLEYQMMPFAAIGLLHPNKWWIGGILIAELSFAVGQIICLYC